jgi:Tfp pilus assembly protein PilP
MRTSIKLFFVLLLLCGCSNPVKMDVKNYSSQIRFLSQDEADILKRWNSVSGANFVNDGYMYQALDNYIVDNYDQFVTKLEKIQPLTKQVQDLHALYVKGAEKQLEAFKLMKEGVGKKDKNIMNNAYKIMTDGRDIEKQWAAKYEELVKAN